MTELQYLAQAAKHFADLDEEDFNLSLPYWEIREYKKGDVYNNYKQVCRYMGFIINGIFRAYFIDEKSGEERNAFIYSRNQFVVTFKSFLYQVPCDYYTQAMTDATVVCIGLQDLLHLYSLSHKWEKFGRLLAQAAFSVAADRAESMLFKTPEERYREMLQHHPDIFNELPLYHISSYLGIQAPSLSRIRKRITVAKHS